MPCACAQSAVAASHIATSALSRLRLLQERVEKAVMRFVRKHLAGEPLYVGMRPGQTQASRIVMSLEEPLNLIVVFLAKHRARHVKQFTITAQQLPKRVQHCALTFRKTRNIVRTPEPFDIGMPPHHA